MLNVGDKVFFKDEIKKEIREKNEEEEDMRVIGGERGLGFKREMRKYIDMELTISEFDEDGYLIIEEDGGDWYWSPKWFDKVNNELKGVEDF